MIFLTLIFNRFKFQRFINPISGEQPLQASEKSGTYIYERLQGQIKSRTGDSIISALVNKKASIIFQLSNPKIFIQKSKTELSANPRIPGKAFS